MDHHNSEIYYRLQSYIIPRSVPRSEGNAMLGKESYGIRLRSIHQIQPIYVKTHCLHKQIMCDRIVV